MRDSDGDAGQEVEPSTDRRARRGTGEELGERKTGEVDEDPAHWAREQVATQAGVDGVTPRTTDQPRHG